MVVKHFPGANGPRSPSSPSAASTRGVMPRSRWSTWSGRGTPSAATASSSAPTMTPAPSPTRSRVLARRRAGHRAKQRRASGGALFVEIAPTLHKLLTPWGCRPRPVRRRGTRLRPGAEPGGRILPRRQGVRPGLRRRGRLAPPTDAVRRRDRPRHGRRPRPQDRPGREQREPRSCLEKDARAVARRLKATAFRNRVGQAVLDDHLALNNAGIPAIDIIDFDYPHWHTSQDLPENCSAASLEEFAGRHRHRLARRALTG